MLNLDRIKKAYCAEFGRDPTPKEIGDAVDLVLEDRRAKFLRSQFDTSTTSELIEKRKEITGRAAAIQAGGSKPRRAKAAKSSGRKSTREPSEIS